MNTLEGLKLAGVPIGTIVDVGVNYSTPQLIRAFRKHKHVLIEPISDYFPAIKKNYAGMDYELVEAAANDADGEVFIESEAKFGDGKLSHSQIVDGPGPNRRSVPSLTVDTILAGLQGLKEPFFFKIDVEGAEIPSAILRGATETLRRSSVVMIELTVPKFMERAALISQAGFQLYGLDDLSYYKDALWQVDGIFVRNELIEANPTLRPMSVKPFDHTKWKVSRPLWERAYERLAMKLGI